MPKGRNIKQKVECVLEWRKSLNVKVQQKKDIDALREKFTVKGKIY